MAVLQEPSEFKVWVKEIAYQLLIKLSLSLTWNIQKYVCFSFLSPERRSEVVLEEKPESSLVKNVSFAGHVNNQKIHPDSPVDEPQGQHCTSCNANDSSLDCIVGALQNPRTVTDVKSNETRKPTS